MARLWWCVAKEVAEEPVSLRRVGVEEAVAAPRRRLIPAPSLLPSPPSPTGRPPPPWPPASRRRGNPSPPIRRRRGRCRLYLRRVAVVAARPLAAVPHLGFREERQGGDWAWWWWRREEEGGGAGGAAAARAGRRRHEEEGGGARRARRLGEGRDWARVFTVGLPFIPQR
jgi:hypothetical protein